MNTGREKILVRGVNWLGDAVMSTPALLRLREAKPQAHITILTHEKLADLWRGHAAVDEVIPFTTQESVFQIGDRLRMGKFKTALILPNSPRSALEAFCGKIPERIGYSRPWRNLLLTLTIAPRSAELKMRKRSVREIKRLIATGSRESLTVAPEAHHIHQYLHLVAKAFGANPEPIAPRLEVTSDEIIAVRQRFQIGCDRRWVGINAGAEYGPAKRWPLERFIDVAAQILKRPDWGVVLFGGKADVLLTSEISTSLRLKISDVDQSRIVDVAGRTSLRQLCATMKCCQAILTNDTGPMHVAAALGVPVVVPFGSTSPVMTGPGLPGATKNKLIVSSAVCSPCFLRNCPIDFRCMTGISVDSVLAALFEAVK